MQWQSMLCTGMSCDEIAIDAIHTIPNKKLKILHDTVQYRDAYSVISSTSRATQTSVRYLQASTHFLMKEHQRTTFQPSRKNENFREVAEKEILIGK